MEDLSFNFLNLDIKEKKKCQEAREVLRKDGVLSQKSYLALSREKRDLFQLPLLSKA